MNFYISKVIGFVCCCSKTTNGHRVYYHGDESRISSSEACVQLIEETMDKYCIGASYEDWSPAIRLRVRVQIHDLLDPQKPFTRRTTSAIMLFVGSAVCVEDVFDFRSYILKHSSIIAICTMNFCCLLATLIIGIWNKKNSLTISMVVNLLLSTYSFILDNCGATNYYDHVTVVICGICYLICISKSKKWKHVPNYVCYDHERNLCFERYPSEQEFKKEWVLKAQHNGETRVMKKGVKILDPQIHDLLEEGWQNFKNMYRTIDDFDNEISWHLVRSPGSLRDGFVVTAENEAARQKRIKENALETENQTAMLARRRVAAATEFNFLNAEYQGLTPQERSEGKNFGEFLHSHFLIFETFNLHVILTMTYTFLSFIDFSLLFF